MLPPTDNSQAGEERNELDAHLLTKLTETEVFKLTKSINTSKSSGLDNISSTVIKVAFQALSPEVTFMYNLSIADAHFPEDWKKALVIPIPKQGNLTKVQNYRPISLLPLPGKVLEKLIHQQLSLFFKENSLLADEQHGFRRNHSTIHAISQVTDYINTKMDARLAIPAVFIDFRKAFDCVQHSVLLGKLRNMGLGEIVIDWIRSYLSNRQQRVFANDTYSTYQNVTQGVPQGSVLGPLFYIVYANDLAKAVKNCKIAMYADDTVLYTSNKDFGTSVRHLQEDIDSLNVWCGANGINANTDKTKVMIFGTKCTLGKLAPFELKFGTDVLQLVSSYKYLGLTLDGQLNYNLHISKVVGSVTDKLKQFQRMRNFLSTKAAIMVYKGMILPILEYGDIFFHAASVVNRKRLQVLQNKGLRCALNRGFETGSVDLHKEVGLLKVHFRREQHTLNFMYDKAQITSNIRSTSKLSVKTRSSNKTLLKVKRPRTEKFKRSLAYVGPHKWNALPERFHHAQTKMAYKAMVRDWVILKAISNESSFLGASS